MGKSHWTFPPLGSAAAAIFLILSDNTDIRIKFIDVLWNYEVSNTTSQVFDVKIEYDSGTHTPSLK